jgi:hypothetical protein
MSFQKGLRSVGTGLGTEAEAAGFGSCVGALLAVDVGSTAGADAVAGVVGRIAGCGGRAADADEDC